MTTFKRDFTFRDNVIEVVARNVRKYRKIISNDFLRRFESTFGKEGMSLNTLYKISVVLDVSMEKFLIKFKSKFPK